MAAQISTVSRALGLATLLACSLLCSANAQPPKATWTADNGNGTFTNPLFYDEFSDPDMIRVGDDFYLTGTTMHAMPGLPILHSRDLVNWRFLGYASDQLDLGPAFRLEDGKNSYGQGIWAPSFRYHKGTFYIFSNVNGQKTQIFTATDPKGPWTRKEMKRSMHDLSVLFDDDGKVYAIWGYREVKMVQLTDDLTDVVPGSERIIIPVNSNMGEGHHFYKLNGKYYILSAWFAGRMRMPAARADRPEGPYEINDAISIDEDFGLAEGYRLSGKAPPFEIKPPDPTPNGRMSLHQGGILQAVDGQWWGFSMMDYNSVGRLLSLSPVTWKDGWPYFGLPGNLGRTPRTWVKPYSREPVAPAAVFERSDSFAAPTLKPIWQWNHVPVNSAWSLTERPGFLRLHALPANSLWDAKNTLTQRSIGPRSTPIVSMDASHLKVGDVAGLALLNRPYAWIGVERTADGLAIAQFDQQTGQTSRQAIGSDRVWLKADCDFLSEKARFSYSTDGVAFTPLGGEFTMVFQLTTFQGVRYALFNYSSPGSGGGYADFDAIKVDEPLPTGLMKPIPYGRAIHLKPHGQAAGLRRKGASLAVGAAESIHVEDLGLGRVALRLGGAYITVAADASVTLAKRKPGQAQGFQWIETPTGELVLMSLVNHRFLRIDPATRRVTADSPGPQSDGKDGVRFDWSDPGAGLVAAKPLFRDPVSDGAADTVVVYNPTRKRWWMFYTNRRATTAGLNGVAWVHGTRIGIAESADEGASWQYVGVADIELPPELGGANATHWAPDIVRGDDGAWHMYLTVVPGVFEDWAHPRHIVHLTSRDLRSWRGATAIPLASNKVIDAAVTRMPGIGWRMWYNNEPDKKAIYYADSADLVHWTDRGRAVVDQPGEGPKVFQWRGAWWMITDVWRGLAVYRSDDGLDWKRQPDNLLEQPGNGADDQVKGGHADVVVSGDRAFLFYFTHPGRRGADLNKDGVEQRRSSIQVVELTQAGGWLRADRDAPTRIQLRTPAPATVPVKLAKTSPEKH